MQRASCGALAGAYLLFSALVHAGRPMIADDAGVVGKSNLQLETWLRLDEETLEHWAVLGFGPLEPLELSLGGRHGSTLESDPRYGATGPLLQAKYLVFAPEPRALPGLALAAGLSTFSLGAFSDEVWSGYGYAAVTQILGSDEGVLIHANVGAAHSGFEDARDTALIWAIGSQLRVIGGLYCFGELFSGDPDTDDADGAAHAGAKYAFSDSFHIDATFGTGVWGDAKLPPFATAGIRWQTSF